jgi:hypothetical protein
VDLHVGGGNTPPPPHVQSCSGGMKCVRELPFTVNQYSAAWTRSHAEFHLPEGPNRTCLTVFSTDAMRRLDSDNLSAPFLFGV